MAVSKEELVEALSNLKVMEVVDLIKQLEEKWGVSAAAAVAVAAPAAGGEADEVLDRLRYFGIEQLGDDGPLAGLDRCCLCH